MCAPVYTCVCDMFICVCVSAAGKAFCIAARLHMQLQNKHDSATGFVDAANAFKKADPQGKTKGEGPLYTQAHTHTHSHIQQGLQSNKAFYVCVCLCLTHVVVRVLR